MKPGHAQIEVSRAVRVALRDYRTALQSGFNRDVGDSDLLAAFLAGVPYWQAELMLQARVSQELAAKTPEKGAD